MSTEENKALARDFYDTHQSADRLAEGRAMITDDFRAYGLSPEPLGAEGFEQVGAYFLTAFSDIEQTIEDQVAEGDTIVNRGVWKGTHTGDFQGVPASGKRVTMTWMGLDRIRDGKIAEHWAQMDVLGLLQQIGAIPQPEERSVPQ